MCWISIPFSAASRYWIENLCSGWSCVRFINTAMNAFRHTRSWPHRRYFWTGRWKSNCALPVALCPVHLPGKLWKPIRCVELELGSRRKLCVTRGNQNAQQVLRILGITQLDPPTPEQGQESLM